MIPGEVVRANIKCASCRASVSVMAPAELIEQGRKTCKLNFHCSGCFTKLEGQTP